MGEHSFAKIMEFAGKRFVLSTPPSLPPFIPFLLLSSQLSQRTRMDMFATQAIIRMNKMIIKEKII